MKCYPIELAERIEQLLESCTDLSEDFQKIMVKTEAEMILKIIRGEKP